MHDRAAKVLRFAVTGALVTAVPLATPGCERIREVIYGAPEPNVTAPPTPPPMYPPPTPNTPPTPPVEPPPEPVPNVITPVPPVEPPPVEPTPNEPAEP